MAFPYTSTKSTFDGKELTDVQTIAVEIIFDFEIATCHTNCVYYNRVHTYDITKKVLLVPVMTI